MKRNRRTMMKSALIFSIISISILLTSSVQAAWVPLTGDFISVSSIPAGGLEVGDKLFTDFEVTAGIVSGGPPEPTADTLLVQGGYNDATGDIGLRLRLAWTVGSDQLINAALNFKVSILDEPEYEPWLIEDAALWTPIATGTGTGSFLAIENIFDADFMGICVASLQALSQDDCDSLLDSSLLCIDEEPVQLKEIWVRMSVNIQGGDSGAAGVHEVFMLYSQIPEPATILMLGLGSLALLRIRKR